LKIKFLNILDASLDTKNKIRHWRNSPRVRKQMLNQNIISIDEHQNWLSKFSKDSTSFFWIILINNHAVGCVSLYNIDYCNGASEWGFYIGEDNYLGKGLSKIVLYKFFILFFRILKLKKLITVVLLNNIIAQSLYEKLGFIKINSENNIIDYEFTASKWLETRKSIKKLCVVKK